MNRNNGRGIVYMSCLVTLMMASFASAAYSQQSKPKAAPLPKYSRNWTGVVQKIVWAFDTNRMMEIGMRAGLEVSTNKGIDFQFIEFDDPVTHQPVLLATICEDSLAIPASARVH